MMRTIRARFLLSHILPILLVLPLFGFGLVYLLETQVLLKDLSADVDERANLIADVVSQQPFVFSDPEEATNFVARMDIVFVGDVSLLGPDGSLLASSDPAIEDIVGVLELDDQNLEKALEGQSTIWVSYSVIRQRGEALVPVLDVNEELLGIVAVTETLTGIASQFSQLRQLALIILVAELLLAILVALIFSRRLGKPIMMVGGAVEEIAQGQRIEPIPVKGPEEVRQLASSVNLLAARLRSLEDTRRRLLANMVHEIGRPLGAIRAAIHTLRRGAADDPVVRDELLTGIENEIMRMQPLLDDLAQLHGQLLGTLELNREPVALSDWLPPLMLPWREAAQNKGLSWEAEIPADLPTVNLDANRMGQVVGNLLSNAVKYSAPGGQVAVSAGANADEAWIKVTDSGPGIVPAEQEQVFEPFFRSRQQQRFPQGLGLGLTIARDMTVAHGGRLEVESQAGEGSTFSVYLPIE